MYMQILSVESLLLLMTANFYFFVRKKTKKNRKGQLYKTLKPRIISCIFNGLVI